MKNKISIIIIAGNEEKNITECLKSCLFADQIVLVAANSSDNTKEIAKKVYPKIEIEETNDEYNRNFTKWRNIGFKRAIGDWILYVDCDERITNKLRQEIIDTINNDSHFTYYAIPRSNHYLNHRVKYGGSYPDYVKRLYRRLDFHGYQGILHEEPITSGDIGHLENSLLHFTHTDLHSMLTKSLVWTDMEAEALFKSNHPSVVWWRFPRMIFTKLWERLIVQQSWRDGTVGWISAIFESFDTFMIYARLWELQQSRQINKK